MHTVLEAIPAPNEMRFGWIVSTSPNYLSSLDICWGGPMKSHNGGARVLSRAAPSDVAWSGLKRYVVGLHGTTEGDSGEWDLKFERSEINSNHSLPTPSHKAITINPRASSHESPTPQCVPPFPPSLSTLLRSKKEPPKLDSIPATSLRSSRNCSIDSLVLERLWVSTLLPLRASPGRGKSFVLLPWLWRVSPSPRVRLACYLIQIPKGATLSPPVWLLQSISIATRATIKRRFLCAGLC